MKKRLILPVVFGIIFFGFGFANSAQATTGTPIQGIPVGLEGEPGLAGDPIPGTEVGLEGEDQFITASDLGVDSVGTLPTSPFYFLKQWGRGITRLFTFNPIAKAQLELNITNQIAADVLEVEKSKPDDTEALRKALENYTDAQERLNTRLAKLTASSENPNVAKLLKSVDEKTALHVAVLEQITYRAVWDDTDIVHATRVVIKEAQGNTLKTFTFTVTNTGGVDTAALTVKQKAEEQIELAGVAIDDTNGAFGQVSTTRGVWRPSTDSDVSKSVTVPKQTQGATFGEKARVGDSDDTNELDIFDRWGKSIAKAMENLSEANKAFTEGKYGEAYGLARSAEAMVSGIKEKVTQYNNNQSDSKVAPKQSPEIIGNQSPEERPAPAQTESRTPSKFPTGNASGEVRDDQTEQKEEPKPTSAESKTIDYRDEATGQAGNSATQPTPAEPKPMSR